MQTANQRTSAHVMRHPNPEAKRRERSVIRTGYVVYSGIDDFLKAYPVATMNRYGERVISGRRIC